MYGGQPTTNVDVTGWYFKSNAVKTAFAVRAPVVMAKIAQLVYARAKINLSGPNYGVRRTSGGLQVFNRGAMTGKMPVPRPTGTLARSLTIIPITPLHYAIFADQRIAHYAKFVHNGTRHMKPRRFLGDPIRQLRASSIQMAKMELIKVIRAVGTK